jgi:hypothetical protein
VAPGALAAAQHRSSQNKQTCARASFLCPNDFLFEQSLHQKAAARHPMKIATIRLQWNPKPKMMPPPNITRSRRTKFHFGRSGGFIGKGRDLFKCSVR